ncbi:MAG: protein kinase [Gemmatales bacterium]|nr:protein kinase [Gemmatales bacterium]MDW8222021.1 protein kinase [Gemmatales bacterium]
MTGQELGACEWFVWDLRRSDLLDRNLVDKATLDFLQKHPQAEPQELAEYLIAQGLLTRFQAESLLHRRANALVVGPYVLHEPIGTGSLGTVYRARSRRQPDQWFAVKILPRRSMWNIRLAKRQVREFESFSHPAVVPFADIGTSGGLHYLVWPYVEGETLDKVVAREGRLEPGRAIAYVIQAAEGLAVCHERGLIHAFIKPSNLLRTPQDQISLLDFGVGSLLMENEGESVVDTMSSANAWHNNLDCASPESIADPSQIGPASDQYSLGCVLFYLLSGKYPFIGETAIEKMMAHQTQTPQSLRQLVPEVPDMLETIIQRMLAKKPAERYPNLLHVIQALGPYLQGPAAFHAAWCRSGRATAATPKTVPAAGGIVLGASASDQATPLPQRTWNDPVGRRFPSGLPAPACEEFGSRRPTAGVIRDGELPAAGPEGNRPRTPLNFTPTPGFNAAGKALHGSEAAAGFKSAGASPTAAHSSPGNSLPGPAPGNFHTPRPRGLLTPPGPGPTTPQESSQSPGTTWLLVILGVACGALAYYLSQLFL